MLSAYALPSISAIAIKIILFWRARNYILRTGKIMWVFFISLLGLNLAELMLFTQVNDGRYALQIISAYYIFAVWTVLSLTAFTLEVTEKIKPFMLETICFIGFATTALLLIPGAALSGTESIGYSVTRVPGPYYFVLQAVIVIPLLTSLSILSSSSLGYGPWRVQKKSIILLICILPLVLSVVGVVILMQFGVKINATVIVSFAINFLLLGILYVDQKARLYGILAAVPGTEYSSSTLRLIKAFLDPELSLKEARDVMDIEKLRAVLIYTEGNQTKAAKILGCSRSSVCRLAKLIKDEDEQR